MLDIKLLETETEYVKSNLNKRNFDTAVVDQILLLNEKRKSLIKFVEDVRSKINSHSKEIGQLKRTGENADNLMAKVTDLKNQMSSSDQELSTVDEKIKDLNAGIPNLISERTPVGKSEDDNHEIKKFGEIKKFNFEVKDHATLGENLKMLDFEIAAEITGSRFVVYKNLLARMERAIANFMIDFHLDNGYEEIIPPFLVNDKSMFGTGQLPKFAEDAFKIEGRDWYLIPTAEVPVTNLKRNQVFKDKEFPIKYVAHTPCFRSEAGSYGKDTRGLIRMHQFSKVEMVNITSAEDSQKAHEEMVDSACKILELLNLPYRAVRLCSGDIGFGSRETVDLEVWLPSQAKYREISSISNCWDFQARRAGIRHKEENGKPQFAHTLNGSGLAVGRTLVAIMENYQNEDGSIIVPKVLVPYMRGIEQISLSF
jgi:seryl-tRNA synthetase